MIFINTSSNAEETWVNLVNLRETFWWLETDFWQVVIPVIKEKGSFI